MAQDKHDAAVWPRAARPARHWPFAAWPLARPRRQLAIVHCAQLAAERLLGDGHPELIMQPLAQINDPPAHDAMDRRRRPAFDDRGEGRAMRIVQP